MNQAKQTRREFVKAAGVSIGGVLGAPFILAACHAGTGTASAAGMISPSVGPASGWDIVPGILQRIKPPTFPARDFDVTKYGASGNGSIDCTGAFRKTIEACHAAGGGRVVVPAGTFVTGAVHLLSNVNLHVTKGATIAFSTDPKHYLPPVLTRFEGVEVMNFSPLIYAFGQENIAITGDGILDGRADCTHWWPWKGKPWCGWKSGDADQTTARKRLFDMAEHGVPVTERIFGEGDYLRPQFIQPYRCRNVLIEGVTIRNSPMWEIHPVLSQNVTVRRITVESLGPNNDGCDPESCRDVLIEDCYFSTGDDCIAIKSGRNADGRRIAVPSENIIVRGCHMKDGHGGVSIGSEISGGVRNVFVEHCRMDSPHLERMTRLKTNAMRGGILEHVYMRDIIVGEVADAILTIDFFYEEGEAGAFLPTVRDIDLRNITSQKSTYALYLHGFVRDPITNVRVSNCSFANVAKPNVVENVTGLQLHGVKINGALVSK